MAIKNFYQLGGQFIDELNVYGDLNLNGNELSEKIAQAAKDGGHVDNMQGSTQIQNIPANLPMPNLTMIKAACLSALTLEDEIGERVFTKKYYWQSIWRILKDISFVEHYNDFVEMVQNLFPEDKMPDGCERLYLSHYTNFNTYDNGRYAGNFDKWSKTDSVTGSVDPRYLIAEKFKETLNGLRLAAALKQNK